MSEDAIPVAVWLKQARALFGDDTLTWRFQCPVCGHIQTPGDFKALGVEPQNAYQNCIGRHLPSRASNFASTPGQNGELSPCDYAIFGLFQISKAPKVIAESGKAIAVFAFAAPATQLTGPGNDVTAPDSTRPDPDPVPPTKEAA